MASLKEYFDFDFGHTLKIGADLELNFADRNTTAKVLLSFDSISQTNFRSFYFEEKDLSISFFKSFLDYIEHYTHLKVGDRLRESIEKGIKECQKCVLILTPNFISNNGWTKTEFNSIFTREIIEEKVLVLPVWCGVTKQQVYEYSPSLLNVIGLNWDTGIDNVVSKLSQTINPQSV